MKLIRHKMGTVLGMTTTDEDAALQSVVSEIMRSVSGRMSIIESDNRRNAWAAISMIRDAVETLGPVGALVAGEHIGPAMTDEAEAIVAGIQRLADAK